MQKISFIVDSRPLWSNFRRIKAVASFAELFPFPFEDRAPRRQGLPTVGTLFEICWHAPCSLCYPCYFSVTEFGDIIFAHRECPVCLAVNTL
jgi:hypothetical protein